MSCPSDFDLGLGSSCRIRCPFDFTYQQNPDRCVHRTRTNQFVTLNSLPAFRANTAEPRTYNDERQRFNAELGKVRTAIQTFEAAQSRLRSAQAENVPLGGKVKSVQTQNEGYDVVKNVTRQFKSVLDTLRRPRQPVAPTANIDEERQKVLALAQTNMQLLQVALATVMLCLVTYLIFPLEWANGIAFLVACGGIAVGIFLTST